MTVVLRPISKPVWIQNTRALILKETFPHGHSVHNIPRLQYGGTRDVMTEKFVANPFSNCNDVLDTDTE